MPVLNWPSYLLRGVPADTRAAISEQAQADDVSLADVIRLALCARYNLECERVSFGYQHQLDTGNDVIIVRIQPEVWALMKKETRNKYGEKRKLILESIDAYLEANA